MKHTYHIEGMSCSGCEGKVQKDLATIEDIIKVEVSKDKKEAVIEMTKHIELNALQKALGGKDSKYQISVPNSDAAVDSKTDCCSSQKAESKPQITNNNHQAGKFCCPMHCEGDKVYDKAGDCPVCGMDLVQQPVGIQKAQYTCPMLLRLFKMNQAVVLFAEWI